MFELIKPIVTHRFNDTIADHDEPGIGAGVGKVLVNEPVHGSPKPQRI
jgi:hypothetical protein